MLKSPAPVLNQYQHSQTTPATAFGTNVPNQASVNTKNTTWTTLIASLDFDCQLIVVNVENTFSAATDSSTLLDIGIGAAASESVLIPDLLIGWAPTTSDAGAPRHYIFPLYIPSGSRISARTASVLGVRNNPVWIQCYGGTGRGEGWWCGTEVTAYGITSASSKGTSITPGASSAEGTWTSIGTTTRDHKVVVAGLQLADMNAASQGLTLDVGIDTASTAVLLENYRAMCDASERVSMHGVWWPIYQPVKSGDVLAARMSSTIASPDTCDVALYGVS